MMLRKLNKFPDCLILVVQKSQYYATDLITITILTRFIQNIYLERLVTYCFLQMINPTRMT